MKEKNIRDDFPILQSGVVYLDSAATSLTPEPVVQSLLNYYHRFNANIERGVYTLSQEASEQYLEAHRIIAKFLNVNENEVVFTKNSTEGINLVAHTIEWKEGDKIVTTLIEHHSNYLPWLYMAKKYNLRLERIKPDKNGHFNLKDFEDAIDDNTKLVAVNHISNVLGTISPLSEIVKIAKKHNALVLADGAQAAPHIPLDLKSLNLDFYAISGHKMMGPTGTGVLYINSRNLDWFKPAFVGGGIIKDVEMDSYTLADGFERFEAGTPNIAGGIGLGAAAEYLSKYGMKNVEAYENEITGYFLDKMQTVEGIEIYGPLNAQKRVGVVSFNLSNIPPHRVAFLLSEKHNIAVRSGLHCAHPLVKYILNVPNGTVRASAYIYNTKDEIDKLVSALNEIRKMG